MKNFVTGLFLLGLLSACGGGGSTVSRDLQSACATGNVEVCTQIALDAHKKRYGL